MKQKGNRAETRVSAQTPARATLPCDFTLASIQFTLSHKHSQKLIVISCETLKDTVRNSSYGSLLF